MDKIEIFKNFLLNNLNLLEFDGAGGENYRSPDFDLNPHDYLKFAKLELDSLTSTNSVNNKLHILNCVFHLKRAVDCQLDVFLYQLKLYDIVKDSNLGFERKLDFIKDIGIIESSSLARLNRLRNKMEHHYKYPDILEIQVYYDLVNAVVSLIESNIVTFLSTVQLNLHTNECRLDLEYNFSGNPNIILDLRYLGTSAPPTSITVDFVTERKEFTYYLKVALLLGKSFFLNLQLDKNKLL
ncbi:hypothetical protein [Oceanobacillus kapialis]|uniref:DZIP3-like HEPN domain-containing protein n=1 Tax=Oceanobacillus kapialis TaxID=481353 RepID=A0ABW5PZC9_9BACI